MAPDGRARRSAGLVWGLALLLWLPQEDQTPRAAVMLAAAAAGLGLWRGLASRPPGWAWAGGGAMAGLAVAPLAVALILVKSGLHAHGFLELGPRVLLALLLATPGWGLGGALAGGLAAIFFLQRRSFAGGQE